MAQAQSKWLLALAGAGTILVGLAWLFLRSAPVELPSSAADAPADLRALGPAEPIPGEVAAPREVEGPGTLRAPSASAESSVAWPVKVELELLRGAHLPRAKDAPPMGSGATARLRGRLARGESGLAGRVTFTGGPNAGRVLTCNERGEFGAVDLYPGLAEVRVDAPGFESVREVRLRAQQVEELNISYDLPGQFYGQVFDRDGRGLEGVDVELDGQHTLSDAEGVFHYGSTPGGDAVQLVLRKEGFASQSARVAVAAGRTTEKGRYTFTLHPAASLELVLGPRVGSRDDALLILLPEVTGMQRSYPWHRLSPMRVKPGTTVRLDDLPAMRVSVRVFHDGARAEPETATAFLQPGQLEIQQVRFEPAPALNGVVQDAQGRRIEGARVVCEAPDRVGATLQYLKSMPRMLEEEVIPTFPPGASEARTNFNGEFMLSTWPEVGEVRYLWAESADGKLWGGRTLRAGDSTLQLVVAPVEAGRAALSLDFVGRHQGLPVVVSVGGKPREEVMVPADEPLRIEGLATGTWRLRAAWNGRSMLPGGVQEFELERDKSLDLVTPQGAVTGQDADTLLRAGRSLPSFLVAPISNDGR